VASKLVDKFFKPVILISFEGEEGKGSGRSIQGFDLHNALTLSSTYLEKYGGHEMAVGLSMKKDMFDGFKEEFKKIVSEHKVHEIIPTIKIDTEITIKDMNKQVLEELSILEPYGEKNRKPTLCYKNLKIDAIRSLTDGKHLKLILRDGNNIVNAIGFNLGHLTSDYQIGDKVDIAGCLDLNVYNGEETVQISMKDIMKSVQK
jgi:single-stranded-DNA-specific exonuclease